MQGDQLLVEVLGGEVPVAGVEQLKHPYHFVHRGAPGRDPAQAAVVETLRALRLTGMESRVAVLLAEGMTGRGESTIRSHVKHMFAKHGLSRQTELVRLVLSLAGAPETRR